MAWSQAPSPCRRRKRGRQNHPATASRRGSGRTPPGLETERRTPPATLADRFSICSHKNIMATFGRLSTDPKQAQLLPLGAPEPTGGALDSVLATKINALPTTPVIGSQMHGARVP